MAKVYSECPICKRPLMYCTPEKDLISGKIVGCCLCLSWALISKNANNFCKGLAFNPDEVVAIFPPSGVRFLLKSEIDSTYTRLYPELISYSEYMSKEVSHAEI